jgi:lysozyme
MPPLRNKIIGGTMAASIALATPLIADLEGFQEKPYKDIAGVWTVCYGETRNIDTGRVYTRQECDSMLADSVPDYYTAAMAPINPEIDVPITMRAALTSFVYNIGGGAYRKSTMLKKINTGDLYGACQELDRWVYAARMYIKGLANRRAKEKLLCVAELREHAV